MSCRYCGGDFCGASAGGPSMCCDSMTYEEASKEAVKSKNKDNLLYDQLTPGQRVYRIAVLKKRVALLEEELRKHGEWQKVLEIREITAE